MASPVDRPTVCPVLVGRGPYLAALDAHLAAARAGRGATLVITGEAGVGKSRLVAEARTRAAEQGMRVLIGRCFEQDRVLPYAPLRDLRRDRGAAESADPDPFAPLSVSVPAEPAPAAVRDAAQERRRLVHAWARGIVERAAERPALLVIDDAHWADDASLDALLTLARRLADHPILLVVTYRSEALTPSLRHFLAELDRDRLASEMRLPRLSPTEVDAMLRAIFVQPQPIRANFLQAIAELTDGNPFFIEEVIRALVAAGDIFQANGRWERRSLAQLRIPHSVNDAVLQHSRSLSPAADELARLAAVAGRTFDFAVLAALTGQDEAALLPLVRELVRAQIVVEESTERFAFRHALTREAIYAGLMARERRALHRMIAETIERLHEPARSRHQADLAYHYAQGEAWPQALAYGERAGIEALALFAPHAALAHFDRALDAAARLGTEPSATLWRARGQALATVGDFDRAQADFEAALARTRADGDRHAEWRILLDLGGLWAGRDYDLAGEFFAQALTLARALDSPQFLAESLLQVGGWRLNRERPGDAEQCLLDALTIFEHADDRLGIARTVDLLGTTSDIAGDIARMRQRYERAAALFRSLGDRQALASTFATMLIPGGAYIFETVVIPPHIPAEETMRLAEEALALSREVGWRAGEAYTLLNLALHFGAYGDYGAALASIRDGLAIAREINHREWMTAGEWGAGMLLTDLLAVSRAHEHFVRACDLGRASGSRHWLHLTTATLAENDVARGDLDAAAALLVEANADLPMQTLGQRRIWLARAKLALARGDAAGALAFAERLDAAAAGRRAKHDIPLLALLTGECLAALDRHGEAEDRLRATLRIATDRGLLPLRWRSHLALGRWHAARGDDADAAAHYREARAIIDQLAATIADSALQGEFTAHAAALVPPSRDRATHSETRELTRREREVATLIARGRTNRDIANALFLSERTVETHVANILRKLAVPSRAGIAAWMERREPPPPAT